MRNKTSPITRDQAKELGFLDMPHFTVTGNMTFELGRGRQLSLACVGSPNEILFLAQIDGNSNKRVVDAVVLSNYDYDGYLTVEKLRNLIDWFKQ